VVCLVIGCVSRRRDRGYLTWRWGWGLEQLSGCSWNLLEERHISREVLFFRMGDGQVLRAYCDAQQRYCREAAAESAPASNSTSSPDLSNDFVCMPTRSLNTVPNENLFKEMLHNQKSPKYRTGLLFSTSTTPRPSKSIPALLSMHQVSPRNRGPASRDHKLRRYLF
jgi:hypothetical protein